MRATIDKSGFISGGRAEEIYTSMMDAETANRIANRGSMGLADMLLHQLGNRAAEIKTEESD
jgi:Rod binding domain-containing protein